MAPRLPRRNNICARLGVLLPAALLQVGFVLAAEPREEGAKFERRSALAPAQDGAQPLLTVDESTGPEAGQSKFRTWTDASGEYRTEAAFLGFENGQVRLEKRDGTRITIAIQKLAEADQEFVRAQWLWGPTWTQRSVLPNLTGRESLPEDAETRRTTATEEPAAEADQSQVDSAVPEEAMATEPGIEPGSTPIAEEEQPEARVEGLPADSPHAAFPSVPEADVSLRGQEKPGTVEGTGRDVSGVSQTVLLLLSLGTVAVATALVVVLKRRWTRGPRKFARKVSRFARRGERVKKAISEWAAAEIEYSAQAAALVSLGSSSLAEALVAEHANRGASFTEPLLSDCSAVISRFEKLASDLSRRKPLEGWSSQDERLINRFREHLATARNRLNSEYRYSPSDITRVVIPAHRRVVVELGELESILEDTVDSARQLLGSLGAKDDNLGTRHDSNWHREAGERLLGEDRGGDQDTLLAEAAEHFFQAYLGQDNSKFNGNDIVHCGLCLWLTVKRYLQHAAISTIASCRSGAPDELLLTLIVQGDKYPAGVLGRELRELVDPDDVRQLRTYLKTADACFQRGAELGQAGFALVWRVTVLRGSGEFDECRRVMEDAKKAGRASSDDLAEAESLVQGIAASYEPDLRWVGDPQVQWVIPPRQYFRPQLLRSIERVAACIRRELGV